MTTTSHFSTSDVQSSVDHLVERAQIAGADSDTVADLLRLTADFFTSSAAGGDGLTASEAQYLMDSGAFSVAQLAEAEARVNRGDLARHEHLTRIGTVARSLTAAQAAERLGVDASRVRHRQRQGALYGFLVGRSRYYPTWQFVPGTPRALPHLAALLKALPEGWSPASVEGFMTTPQPNLCEGDSFEGGQLPQTPVAWLLGGGPVEPVLDMLSGMAYA
ncbi:hypothetical protein JT358_12905 [Micrococcales bacterium 31B]|nr:hypothetical protein [Micrococcales bacterium 31B]